MKFRCASCGYPEDDPFHVRECENKPQPKDPKPTPKPEEKEGYYITKCEDGYWHQLPNGIGLNDCCHWSADPQPEEKPKGYPMTKKEAEEIESQIKAKLKPEPVSTDELIRDLDIMGDLEVFSVSMRVVKDRLASQAEKIEKAIEILRPIRTMRFDLLEAKTKPIVAEALAELEK